MDNEMNLKLFIFSQMSFDDGYRAGCVIAENEEEAKSMIMENVLRTPVVWGPIENKPLGEKGAFISWS